MIVPAAELKTMAVNVLICAGATPENAECVASHLVNANLRGVDTHGIWQLPGYVAAIRKGELLPRATPQVLQDAAAAALITGNWGFGPIAAQFATEQALCKARTFGISVISIVQCHHIGRLGEYAESAARRGFILMAWVSGLGERKPVVVPYGGTRAVFGTNPLAIGLPAPNECSIVVDFATSATSGVKILEAIRKRESVPDGWLVDKRGVGTTDPQDITEGGGQLSFGGYKGYALTLAIEILGRIFAGADSFVEHPLGGDAFSSQGVTIVALKADLFQPINAYLKRTGELEERVRSVPHAQARKEVLLPGDPELLTLALRQREGITIPDDLWGTLTGLSAGEYQCR